MEADQKGLRRVGWPARVSLPASVFWLTWESFESCTLSSVLDGFGLWSLEIVGLSHPCGFQVAHLHFLADNPSKEKETACQ